MKRWLNSILMTAAVALGATALPAKPLELLPSHTGYQPKDALEKGLWLEMDQAEQQVRASKFLIKDPELNAYVKSVLCRAVGTEKCGSARVYLIRTPQFNAAMAPNGMMLVWSGLLLRARNEAELATVLAHEFAHFEMQHSLQSFRDIKAKSDAMTWAGFVPGGLLAQIGLMGSMFRFNREMEKRADMAALQYLSDAGYDPMAASQIWEQFRGEMEAQAKAGKAGALAEEANDFFSSHPNTQDRMNYLRAAARQKTPNTDTGAARYQAAIAPWWPRLIDDQIRLNDFAATHYLLSGMARGQWSAELLYARAELHRARGKVDDIAAAERDYRAAASASPELAESWRGLGLLLLRQGQEVEGRRMLRRYLEKAPDATDRALIASMAGGARS